MPTPMAIVISILNLATTDWIKLNVFKISLLLVSIWTAKSLFKLSFFYLSRSHARMRTFGEIGAASKNSRVTIRPQHLSVPTIIDVRIKIFTTKSGTLSTFAFGGGRTWTIITSCEMHSAIITWFSWEFCRLIGTDMKRMYHSVRSWMMVRQISLENPFLKYAYTIVESIWQCESWLHCHNH